ncbi:MAG: purine-nucleoside phosphorylase [Campylobacteraceae bacterium]|jgi:nucleoside phosphorylase|nr:purine-nucleoside phosphorylase [Campylobacteraceae bacterium]
MIVCAGNNESFSFATPIGVGLVNASINLTELFAAQKPKNILFIGTVGSYGKFKEFDIVSSNSATNIEIGFLENFSYSPILEQIDGIDANVSHETLRKIVVNSSNFITSNSVQSVLFLKYGLDLENMEFFAVLKAAQKFRIASLGLFCVTNYCNQNAHEEFLQNHTRAKAILENAVFKDYKKFLQ